MKILRRLFNIQHEHMLCALTVDTWDMAQTRPRVDPVSVAVIEVDEPNATQRPTDPGN